MQSGSPTPVQYTSSGVVPGGVVGISGPSQIDILFSYSKILIIPLVLFLSMYLIAKKFGTRISAYVLMSLFLILQLFIRKSIEGAGLEGIGLIYILVLLIIFYFISIFFFRKETLFKPALILGLISVIYWSHLFFN